MAALTGKFPHTHFPKGKRVRIILRDGTEIVDKYVERRGIFVVTENHKILTKNLKAMSYYRGGTQCER